MATDTPAVHGGVEEPEQGFQARAQIWREDLLGSLASLTLVLGLFLDGWNHINLQNGALGGFFTPWHGLLYTGFGATAAWVLTRNPHLYLRGRKPQPYFHPLLGVPLRYPFAVAGIAVAVVGILGDSVWHTVFGEEEGVARVIGPFHLMLFGGAALLMAASFRSAWHAPQYYPAVTSFRALIPPLLSLTLVVAAIAFMFQWLSAFVDWSPSLQLGRVPDQLARDERVLGTVEFAAVARVVVTNFVLLAPVLLALRRWRLPFGSVTAMWTTVAVLMGALTEFRLGGTVLAAFLGGLAADGLIGWLAPGPERPLAYRWIGGVTPGVLWTGYFVALSVFHGITWPTDLSIGTVGVTVLTGVALTFLAVPPNVPIVVWAGEEN